jgi:hypothetical protein
MRESVSMKKRIQSRPSKRLVVREVSKELLIQAALQKLFNQSQLKLLIQMTDFYKRNSRYWIQGSFILKECDYFLELFRKGAAYYESGKDAH